MSGRSGTPTHSLTSSGPFVHSHLLASHVEMFNRGNMTPVLSSARSWGCTRSCCEVCWSRQAGIYKPNDLSVCWLCGLRMVAWYVGYATSGGRAVERHTFVLDYKNGIIQDWAPMIRPIRACQLSWSKLPSSRSSVSPDHRNVFPATCSSTPSTRTKHLAAQ